MTRITDSEEKNKQAMPFSGTNTIETEQILYLKRLLFTLKLQFEKKLNVLSRQLEEEIAKNLLLPQDFQSAGGTTAELTAQHEDELNSLKEQLLILRDLVKKSREETDFQVSLKNNSNSNQEVDLDRIRLMEEVEKKQTHINDLESALRKEREEHRLEFESLNAKLFFYKEQDAQHELIISNNSSYQLRQELELIKQTLFQGAQEAKTIEIRYADLFNDKMTLEHQLKVLNEEFKNHSNIHEKIKIQFQEANRQNHLLQTTFAEKEKDLWEEIKIQNELSDQVQRLEAKCLELSSIQEKYEQLKEEYLETGGQLDEMIELRISAEKQIEEMQTLSQEQEMQLIDKGLERESLIQEREHLLADIEHLHHLLSDSESNLKIAQQHLAKKVKESALLVEKVEEHQNDLTEFMQIIENDKSQIIILQTDLDNLQKQEKRLQEQLHDALKGTENQVAKWEKKYFEMYDKWQTSENHIRELKKLEEKHIQMQNLLSNLGNYMEPSFSPTQLFQAMSSASLNETKPVEFIFNPLQNDDFFKEDELKKEEPFEKTRSLCDPPS